MKKIKLTIDGKEVQLTDEQLKALGVDMKATRKNPFELVNTGHTYYFINEYDDIESYTQTDDVDDCALFAGCNYFNDEAFAHQVALHQLLYRKLSKFAYDNDCEDTAEWDGDAFHYTVLYDRRSNVFVTDFYLTFKTVGVYFNSVEAAEHAIKEVVEPFMKEHPEFKW